MEKFGVGVMNDNGERLCEFCSANGLIITGTMFPRKDIHKLTWRQPDGRTVNQTDRVLVNGNVRTSTLEVIIDYGSAFVNYGNEIEPKGRPVSQPRCPCYNQ